MRVIALPRALLVEIEAVGVLHQELAAAHHAEAGAHLVAELPLDVVERARQIAVALGGIAEDGGDHLLVGRPEEHLALVPVRDPQHFRPIGVVAAGLAPQVGRLDGRHQQLDRAGPVLLLAHDLLDLAEHAMAQRQPGIDAGGGLPDQPGAQHQLVADDLGVGGRFLGDGQEVAGKAHRRSGEGVGNRSHARSSSGLTPERLLSSPIRSTPSLFIPQLYST